MSFPRLIGDEQGGVMVFVAGAMAAFLVFSWLVIDLGNAFGHRRHLQMQADAGALAGAGEFRYPCSDAAIESETARYSGDEHNVQVGGAQPRVHREINKRYWYGQTDRVDSTVREGSPCSTAMIDVKLTETDLPFFIQLANVVPGFLGVDFPFINAHARVEIRQLNSSRGALPVGVEDVRPQAVRAEFVDESSGTVIGTRTLKPAGTSGALTLWDNADAALPIEIPSTAHIGVRIITSGSQTTVCGAPLVECYDTGSTNGVVHIRGYSGLLDGQQPNAPRARSVELFSGSCEDPYFVASTAPCTVGVRARVDFGTLPLADARVKAVVGKTEHVLSHNAATGWWESTTAASYVTVPPNAGPIPVELRWEETTGTQGGNTCTTTGGNKCKGTFGVVQRIFSATSARSGPLKLVRVSEAGVPGANSLRRCEPGHLECLHDLVVTVGLIGSLENAQSVGDPIVSLRVVGGSQNQSLDCDPDKPKLKDELASGCAAEYVRNAGNDCPATASALWATAQPWECVAIQTGSATNQVPAGMNLRVLGAEKPPACTSPNRWSDFPNFDPEDPRIVQVFLVPFNSFAGSGGGTRPVVEFATFYVTGWSAAGSGFSNPCEGQGDDAVPGGDAGYIVGHFIKYVQILNNGGAGPATCDPSAFGSCIAVMTE